MDNKYEKYGNVIIMCVDPNMSREEVRGARVAVEQLSGQANLKVCFIYYVNNGMHIEVFGLSEADGQEFVEQFLRQMQDEGVADFSSGELQVRYRVEEEDD